MGDDAPVEEQQPTPAPKGKPGPKPKVVEPEVVEPSIGRIVRYVTGVGTVRPAIITRVNEESVDLTVFNSEGAVPATAVPFEDAEVEMEHSYHWPAY